MQLPWQRPAACPHLPSLVEEQTMKRRLQAEAHAAADRAADAVAALEAVVRDKKRARLLLQVDQQQGSPLPATAAAAREQQQKDEEAGSGGTC